MILRTQLKTVNQSFVIHVNSSILRVNPMLADSAAVRVQSASDAERGIIPTNGSGIAVPAPPPFASPAQPNHSQVHNRYQNINGYFRLKSPARKHHVYRSTSHHDPIRSATHYEDLPNAPASAETPTAHTPSSRRLHVWQTHPHLAKLCSLGLWHAV
jgi:hypothetical protein